MPRASKTSTFTPTTWVKEIDGVTHERVSGRPSDDVHFQFAGWKVKRTKTAASKADTATKSSTD